MVLYMMMTWESGPGAGSVMNALFTRILLYVFGKVEY
jgi:hypothetical protein